MPWWWPFGAKQPAEDPPSTTEGGTVEEEDEDDDEEWEIKIAGHDFREKAGQEDEDYPDLECVGCGAGLLNDPDGPWVFVPPCEKGPAEGSGVKHA